MKNKIIKTVTLMVTITLCMVIASMVIAMIAGLFTPQVDNDKVFEAITPAFQMIIGGFLGFLTGLSIDKESN